MVGLGGFLSKRYAQKMLMGMVIYESKMTLCQKQILIYDQMSEAKSGL